MRTLPILLALAVMAAVVALGSVPPGAGSARAAGSPPPLTVRTSLGPIGKDDTRNLRARGRAPGGSTVLVRFMRGKRGLGVARPAVVNGHYSAAKTIDRTGEYRVRVMATTRSGRHFRVSAKLFYGPTAQAPSAP